MFQSSPSGAVGLVDQLLKLGREHPLSLHFDGDHCVVRRVGFEESVNVPLPKSAFRAVIARIAAPCNERAPESVTPYRGDGKLGVPPESFRVSFTNTPDEQRLKLRFTNRVVGVGTAEVQAVPRVGGIDAQPVHKAG